jgi:PPOX class probable F420-dependent enzyme
VEISKALEFVREHHMAVLVTRRRDGAPQMSLITAGVDTEGRVEISTRETAAKTKNLRRDPHASVFVIDSKFSASVQIDGTVDIVSMPDALDPLVEYYRRISGEHPDWDEYRAAMEQQRRVLLRITPTRAGPDTFG